MSTPEKLVLSAAGAFAAALVAGGGLAGAGLCGLCLALCAARGPAVLVRCALLGFWLFPIFFFLLLPLWIGTPDAAIGGLRFSCAQLRLGAGFLLQAYAVTVLLAAGSETFSARRIVECLERRGLRGAGLRLALAASVARMLKRMLEETWESYRLDRPGLAASVREAPLLAAAIVRGAARIAEDVSILFFLRDVRV